MTKTTKRAIALICAAFVVGIVTLGLSSPSGATAGGTSNPLSFNPNWCNQNFNALPQHHPVSSYHSITAGSTGVTTDGSSTDTSDPAAVDTAVTTVTTTVAAPTTATSTWSSQSCTASPTGPGKGTKTWTKSSSASATHTHTHTCPTDLSTDLSSNPPVVTVYDEHHKCITTAPTSSASVSDSTTVATTTSAAEPSSASATPATPPSGLAFTGAAVGGLGLLAGVLLISGLAMLGLGSRSKRNRAH